MFVSLSQQAFLDSSVSVTVTMKEPPGSKLIPPRQSEVACRAMASSTLKPSTSFGNKPVIFQPPLGNCRILRSGSVVPGPLMAFTRVSRFDSLFAKRVLFASGRPSAST